MNRSATSGQASDRVPARGDSIRAQNAVDTRRPGDQDREERPSRVTRWFFANYVRRELSRRRRQFTAIALGLAVGIGLVVTVVAASAGVKDAQGRVLHALFGIGTDISVTSPPSPPPGGTGALRAPGSQSAGSKSGGPGFTFGSKPTPLNLLGVAPDLGVLSSSALTSIARLHGVAAAAGGLRLSDTKLTVPSRAQAQGFGGKLPASARGRSFAVDGADVAKLGLGPLGSGSVVTGRMFDGADASSYAAVVDSGYATANGLTVGSTIKISTRSFKVIGIVRQPHGGGADVYIPLGPAQALARYQGANLVGTVNVIYVRAASAADIASVRREIARLLPAATVTSSDTLASAVHGTLASAASLVNDLGVWLAVAAMIVAFAVASLLTLAVVTRRVRELGTLKALGWRSRRIVLQIMAELAVVGAVGAIIGIALGFSGAAVVAAAAPGLSATVAQSPGSTPPQNVTISSAGLQRHTPAGALHTVAVHLNPAVTAGAIGLAVALAITGALIAGALGARRSTRLRPAEALTQVE